MNQQIINNANIINTNAIVQKISLNFVFDFNNTFDLSKVVSMSLKFQKEIKKNIIMLVVYKQKPLILNLVSITLVESCINTLEFF